MIGGECTHYTSLVSDTTAVATERLAATAKVHPDPLCQHSPAVYYGCTRTLSCLVCAPVQSLGANAVLNARVEIATTMNRLIVGLHTTVVCYGTVRDGCCVRCHF